LNLTIPGVCDTTLTGICNINWKQNGSTLKEADLVVPGLGAPAFLMTFAQRVHAEDITENTFRVLFGQRGDLDTCWCEVVPRRVGGIHLQLQNGCTPVGAIPPFPAPNGDLVEGAMFIPGQLRPGLYRIELKGDLVRDLNDKGVDGNHLPPWLPARPTGDGVPGGTFESWLTITQ
jgi:hypothetical protein